jgi:hypothetical protein
MARTTTPEVITAGSHESAVISGKKIRKICVFEDSNLRPQHRFLEYTNQLSYMYIWQYKFRILYCILDIPTNEKFINCKVINHLKLKSCQLQSFRSLETNSDIKVYLNPISYEKLWIFLCKKVYHCWLKPRPDNNTLSLSVLK